MSFMRKIVPFLLKEESKKKVNRKHYYYDTFFVDFSESPYVLVRPPDPPNLPESTRVRVQTPTDPKPTRSDLYRPTESKNEVHTSNRLYPTVV